jgi:hypothetical protein
MPANYVLLERIELNASAASVTFANIPQSGYTDLKVVMSARSSYSSGEGILMQFNGSSGANYFYRQLYGTGSSAGSYTPGSGQTSCLVASMGGTNYTASTFNSVEIYIPNYTSSNNKSFSVDSVAENNSATVNQLDLIAGLWSQTAAITSITFTSYNAANFVANSTFSLYGLAALGTTPVIAPKASGGDVIDFDGTYWIHTFLTTGAFVPQVGLTCDYLVVAGGGGSAGYNGGGAGAGGLRSTITATGGGGSLESALSVAKDTSYTVTVGAGGTAGNNASGSAGTAGSNSVFSTITSIGGGQTTSNANGSTGGSGGGGGGATGTSRTGGAGTVNQGFAGGNNVTSGNYPSGGGGGAGAVGSNGSGSVSGNGGNGVTTSITGTSVTYAGGGGGGSTIDGATRGTGGTGGGGNGGASGNAGTAGTVNTGGGGGGGAHSQNGAAGGSGIVIIRYLAA